MPFLFERQDVYRQALDFAEQCDELTSDFPARAHPVADELRSRSLEVPLLVAAANAVRDPTGRARLLEDAQKAVFACVPLLELLERRSFLTAVQRHNAKLVVDELSRKLTAAFQVAGGKG